MILDWGFGQNNVNIKLSISQSPTIFCLHTSNFPTHNLNSSLKVKVIGSITIVVGFTYVSAKSQIPTFLICSTGPVKSNGLKLLYTNRCIMIYAVVYGRVPSGIVSLTTLPQGIWYSHFGNGVHNGVISIAQWGLLSDCYKVNPIGQWGKILVILMGFTDTLGQGYFLSR